MNNIISIIIPVYNGEKYIAAAIQTCLAQDYAMKEIIVIDDGSTDKTADIVDEFSNHVIYVYQENKGLGAARNHGVRVATGAFIAFLDSDDLCAENRVSSQHQQWWLHREEDPVVFSDIQQFICPSLSAEECAKLILTKEILAGYCGSGLFLSKKRFVEIGDFFEKKQVGEFIEWYQRVLLRNITVRKVPQVLTYRRVHLNNMGRQREIYQRNYYLKILKSGLDQRRQIMESM